MNLKLYIIIILLLLWGAYSKAQPLEQDLMDTANYPYWIDMMQNPDVDFHQTVRAFELYWENREITPGCGYKPFKRWQNQWECRVLPNGKIPLAEDDLKRLIDHQSLSQSKSQLGDWKELGPVQMPVMDFGLGRINCVAFHPTDPNILWVGAPSGGLWKTMDGGSTWMPLTDHLVTLGVSALLVDPLNPSNMYMGTGDRDGGDAYGVGVMKSTDGGVNWTLSNTGMGSVTTGMMVMNPSDKKIIHAATSGGIFKSVDAGNNWALTSSNTNHYKDIRYNPADTNILYATEGGNFYRSADAGNSWVKDTTNFLIGRRMVIGVSPHDPSKVYVVLGKNSGLVGVYLSSDSGQTFVQKCTSPNILTYDQLGQGTNSQTSYDLCISVNPSNSDQILVGGINTWRSNDGGSTWSPVSDWTGQQKPRVHADVHSLDYNPLDQRVYSGNDGGVYYSSNNGTSWVDISSGLGIAQVYKLGQSATQKDLVINGYQDNGSAFFNGNQWETVMGGDGMECLIDYTDAAVMYGSYYYGEIERSMNGATSFSLIAKNGVNGLTEAGAWVTPYALDYFNPNTMYLGYKDLWRSDNVKTANTGNVLWSKTSTGSTKKLKVVEQSMANADLMYVSNSKKLYRTENLSASTPSWQELSPQMSITDMVAHHINDSIVYCTGNNNVYKSNDRGLTWIDISGSLPDVPIYCIVLDTTKSESLYLGNMFGVYHKNDTLNDWVHFDKNLPNVAVRELEIYYDKANHDYSMIRAATYGRGLWESDLFNHTGLNIQSCISDPEIRVFPNPAVDNVSIVIDKELSSPILFQLYSLDGKVVVKGYSDAFNFKLGYDLNLQDLTPGMYILELKVEHKAFHHKILKY
jgi:photosystem II stability/assembly factor-like uncharacterized protein